MQHNMILCPPKRPEDTLLIGCDEPTVGEELHSGAGMARQDDAIVGFCVTGGGAEDYLWGTIILIGGGGLGGVALIGERGHCRAEPKCSFW
jgi:hypothetical protein